MFQSIQNFAHKKLNTKSHHRNTSTFNIYFGQSTANGVYDISLTREQFIKILSKLDLKDSESFKEQVYYDDNLFHQSRNNRINSKAIAEYDIEKIGTNVIIIYKNEKNISYKHFKKHKFNHSELREVIRVRYGKCDIYLNHTLRNKYNKEHYTIYVTLDSTYLNDSIIDCIDFLQEHF